MRGAYGHDQIYAEMAARALTLWDKYARKWKRQFLHRTGVLWMASGNDDQFERESVKSLKAAKIKYLELSSGLDANYTGLYVAPALQDSFRQVIPSGLPVAAPFNESFLDTYLSRAGEPVLGSVGAYQLEGLGAHLFTRVDGDYFTILGLPLLPLLSFLTGHGIGLEQAA